MQLLATQGFFPQQFLHMTWGRWPHVSSSCLVKDQSGYALSAVGERRWQISVGVAELRTAGAPECEMKRLQKELLALQNDPPAGMTLNEKSVQNSITQWIIDMEGASGTLYEGEKFQLLFKFSSRYPFDSPQVVFTGENIPVHPHVYSNGHICLSILTEDWSPALSVQSVCLSIISMLSSCKEKRRPPDNSFYVRTCNKNPKKTKWWYHDDTC
ncbi:ubiquitin-conjugating enzyme E2 W isoform X1 [Crotalus tigris]|uniref:ubiquitin-conjugating enzyme E2 W isoform X1 n=1 Tax=Crotalus tigris TaxID=88082 RepID=UPI00192F8280|nr:ubiquitin-conjugating enzyme E2 W isoform X1 [Crotalus tigris]